MNSPPPARTHTADGHERQHPWTNGRARAHPHTGLGKLTPLSLLTSPLVCKTRQPQQQQPTHHNVVFAAFHCTENGTLAQAQVGGETVCLQHLRATEHKRHNIDNSAGHFNNNIQASRVYKRSPMLCAHHLPRRHALKLGSVLDYELKGDEGRWMGTDWPTFINRQYKWGQR